MFQSTRGHGQRVDAAQAILTGLAPDGGLYVPESFPHLPALESFLPLSYQERAFQVMRPFMDGYTDEQLRECCRAAYATGRFDAPEVAPLVHLRDNEYVLELWHGPTCAFKDMALQMLPHLLTCAQRTHQGGKVLIMVATSGDTGKAALEGFAGVPDTRIVVFYPKDGVSHAQKLQMVTQLGDNTHVVALTGNFDDCQTGVKRLFNDPAFVGDAERRGWNLSSANSINWGRLAPQIAYYVSAYADLVQRGAVACGDPVDFAVPTGNFGNILAAEYARRMGLPIRTLLCASNKNNILTDFFNTGVYDVNRPFYLTPSPSMDILVSSNLERLLFELADRDGAMVEGWMGKLAAKQPYRLEGAAAARLRQGFDAGWADIERARASIRRAWQQEHYLMDPHTAVAQAVAEDWANRDPKVPLVVVSTAHPYKFGPEVARALWGDDSVPEGDEFRLLDRLAQETSVPIPGPLAAVRTLPVRHTLVCGPGEMAPAVWQAWEGERA